MRCLTEKVKYKYNLLPVRLQCIIDVMDGSFHFDPAADLQSEYAAMACGWAVEQVTKAGCSALSLINCGHVAETYAHIEGNQFVPDAMGGKRLIVLPVYDGLIPCPRNLDVLDDHDLQPADLIGWEAQNPAKWYFRLKNDPKAMLGRMNLQAARRNQIWPTRNNHPLTVFPTPLEWLCAGGTGVCPLTRAAMQELRGLKQITCPNRKYGLRLDAELRLPNPDIPQILIPKGAQQNASY
jgi:hypothetical protein